MRGKARFKVFCAVGLFILSICGPISLGNAVIDRVVAVVNQEIITLSEVQRWMGVHQEEIRAEDRLERREQRNAVYRKVLEKLIEEKLIEQEAKRIGTKVTAKEVESALEEVKRRFGASQEDLEKALAREGVTLETYKKEISKKIQRMKLINWAVKVETKVEEKELRDFYHKHMALYHTHELYKPSQIFFPVPKEATAEESQRIRKKCEQVLAKLRSGEDFGELALLYSQDISAKDRGDLGYFKKGELQPALEKEILRLQVGEVSGVIRTSFGFHILKLLDRKGGTPLPFEEVRERVRSDYFGKEMEKALQQFLSTLREKSVIEIKL
jgi:peptidyl-prolyl cis-trans isomerase SurA